MCSLVFRPGDDKIGISLQPDEDFSHTIKDVEPNSLADRAGIERNDCVMSLNNTPLLNMPYENVLNFLKKSRKEPRLDLLVAKKSYLLKSHQDNVLLSSTPSDKSEKYAGTMTDTAAQVMPSSNITGRDRSSPIPPEQALEELYNKYYNEQRGYDDQSLSSHPKQTTSKLWSGLKVRVVGQCFPPF